MSPYKSKEEIAEMRKNLYSVVWPMVSDIENKTWRHKAGTDREKTGLVYKGHHDTIGTVWKIEALLDITPQQFFDTILMKPELTDWIPNLVEYRVIERGDARDWDVIYSHSARIGPISARDFVCANFYDTLADGSRLAMTIATEHSAAPQVSQKIVRGEYLPSACYLRPFNDDPKRCLMYWVSNIDMKGLLPRNIVNLAMSTFMLDFGAAIIGKAKRMSGKSDNIGGK